MVKDEHHDEIETWDFVPKEGVKIHHRIEHYEHVENTEEEKEDLQAVALKVKEAENMIAEER